MKQIEIKDAVRFFRAIFASHRIEWWMGTFITSISFGKYLSHSYALGKRAAVFWGLQTLPLIFN